ncbi:MAG: hypothetical protein V4693_18960 [Pseudomonadota bacterium]
MPKTTKPDKVSVREWIDRRTHPEQEDPPPSPEEIRDQLGWRQVPSISTSPFRSRAK